MEYLRIMVNRTRASFRSSAKEGYSFYSTFIVRGFLLVWLIALSMLNGFSEEINFRIQPVERVETSYNTVTCTVFSSGERTFLYTAGDSNKIDCFEVGKNGSLELLESKVVTGAKKAIRGLIVDSIEGKDLLFAGLKGGDAVEVFAVSENGRLTSVYVESDTDYSHLGRVITLQVVHMESASYLFVGGLEKTPGLSSFEISANGSLRHIQSMADTEDIFTDGIIGMSVHTIGGDTYLFTGGFQDNGLSSFKVFEDGCFEVVCNISDDRDLFLNGAYPVVSATKGGRHYVIVGHRHHIYYRPTPWVKDRDSYFYHGDAVSVFWVDPKGNLVPRSILSGDSSNFIQGQTRLQKLPWNDIFDLIAVGTRDDESIQLCLLNETGRLIEAGKIKTGFPIYYGLTGAQIGEDLFLFAGSVAGKELVSYRVKLSED